MNEGLPHRQFASDNYAGICPEVWQALDEANRGHAIAYGDDAYTAEAADLVREFFETDCDVYFVFNGTAANSLAIASLCRSYHSVLCHEMAHIETDECGAPEFFGDGVKILPAPGAHGKIDLGALEHLIERRSDIHYPKPKVLSISQPTELGTVYAHDELGAIRQLADHYGLKVHMDGARFANALVTLASPPRTVTWEVGVDVLCFGGTKGGMPVGEAVVFFDRGLGEEFDYRCKQAGQLASKMRFLSAPWSTLLRYGGEVLLDHAEHANRMAEYLHGELRKRGLTAVHPVEANAVFVRLGDDVSRRLREQGWPFYDFIGDGGARFMCAWDTTEEDVNALVAAVTADG